MSAETAEVAVDRGDTFVAPDQPVIDLTDDELALIGKTPEDQAEAKAEAQPEAKAKPETKAEEPEKPRDQTGKFIPKARFDELNNKAKDRIAALESTLRQVNERSGLAQGV